jgi:hypothetical protein
MALSFCCVLEWRSHSWTTSAESGDNYFLSRVCLWRLHGDSLCRRAQQRQITELNFKVRLSLIILLSSGNSRQYRVAYTLPFLATFYKADKLKSYHERENLRTECSKLCRVTLLGIRVEGWWEDSLPAWEVPYLLCPFSVFSNLVCLCLTAVALSVIFLLVAILVFREC